MTRYIFGPLTGVLLLFGAAGPQAYASQDDGPLRVLGLSVGQSAADIAPALSETPFKPAEREARKEKTRSASLKQSRFVTDAGDALVFDIASRNGGFTQGRIIGLNYAPVRADDGIALEKKLRAKFGKPLVGYALGNDSHLYVWEQPAPEQSRDFGALLTVSLETGETPVLKISQFSRPAALSGTVAAPVRRAAGRKPAGAAKEGFAGPVD